MRKLLVILALVSACHAQEILRPTAGVASNTACGYSQKGSTGNLSYAYDTDAATYANISTMTVNHSSTEYSNGALFNSWQSASGAYSALTVSVKGLCQAGTYGSQDCWAQWSISGGSSGTFVFSGTADTYTATIPAGTNLANLSVQVCAHAYPYYDPDLGAYVVDGDSAYVYDIWTSGTLPAASSTKRSKVTQQD